MQKFIYAKAKKYSLIRDGKPKRKPLNDITNTTKKITKREENRIRKQVVRECEAIKNASAINRYIINFI